MRSHWVAGEKSANKLFVVCCGGVSRHCTVELVVMVMMMILRSTTKPIVAGVFYFFSAVFREFKCTSLSGILKLWAALLWRQGS